MVWPPSFREAGLHEGEVRASMGPDRAGEGRTGGCRSELSSPLSSSEHQCRRQVSRRAVGTAQGATAGRPGFIPLWRKQRNGGARSRRGFMTRRSVTSPNRGIPASAGRSASSPPPGLLSEWSAAPGGLRALRQRSRGRATRVLPVPFDEAVSASIAFFWRARNGRVGQRLR